MRRTGLWVALLLLPTLVLAQAETTGRIEGHVTDESGAPIAGAKVSVISAALQGERTFTTDENGRFLAALLPPGVYNVTVSAPNAKPREVTVGVRIGQTSPLEIPIVGGEGLSESVTVYGSMSKLETTANGENFDYEGQIDNLPVINRDPERVAELAPNISFGPTPNTLSISGAPSFDTVVLLDGAEVSDPYFGSAPRVWVEEALEEVQVLTSGISARYGRFQGGVVNATTKSGGNTFDGSARIDLSKETWNQKSPFGETQSDDLNKVFSATLGGPIIKNHLTFFVAGRTIPTFEEARDVALSGESFIRTSDEDRLQGKLTGSINPDHVIEASYLYYDSTLANYDGLPPADLRALGTREDPRKTTTIEYQGVISDKMFVNLQGTRKRVSIDAGADDASLGSPFFDFYGSGFQVWHNHWWDLSDSSLRDNDTLSAGLTHVLTTGSWGEHTLEYGIQYVNSKTGGENRQSITGLNLLNYDSIVSGNLFSDVDVDATEDPDPAPLIDFADLSNPMFNLISLSDGGLTYRWEALPLGGGQELKNTALYVQDGWQKGRWRVDAGLRWETYKGTGPEPTLNLDISELAPRVGVTYNMDNNWQLQGSWGKYVSRFNDNVASTVSGVGGAPYIVSLYTGPTVCPIGTYCMDYDAVEAALQNDANWGVVTTVTDPTQPTRFLADDVGAPYAYELNLAVKRALPKNTGTVTFTYTNRQYRDLLDDFVGGFGTVTVNDPNGGPDTFDLDVTIWDNANQAKRDYQSLVATWDYRPSANWGVGGNWTYARTQTNYEGEGRNTPASGTDIGNYVNSIPQQDAIPYGYSDDDIRHRFRGWGHYRWDFGRPGALTLGTILSVQSGLAYSLTAAVDLNDDPTYLNDAGTTYTHYFGGRGTERFHGFWRADLSARYQFKLWKDLAATVKFDILNVTNNDSQIAANVGGSADTNPAGTLVFMPGSGFGQARNRFDYQTPRSYFLAFGVQW